MNKCYLCDKDVKFPFLEEDDSDYDCDRCGRVKITYEMKHEINSFELRDIKYLFSGYTQYRKENGLEPITITIDNYKSILESYVIPRTVSKRQDLLLKYICKRSEYPGSIVEINVNLDYPIAFCRNPKELEFYLKFLCIDSLLQKKDVGYKYIVSAYGWNKLDNILKSVVKKNQAFIAMWFDENLNNAYNGISKAVKDCGYEKMRIDMKEHNKKIDDEIVAEIRNSAFLIADFTGQRGGVYFEAGFAMGLGIPVIWTCRKEETQNLHFDTRQYNHIEWETTEELYNKLVNRIKATII